MIHMNIHAEVPPGFHRFPHVIFLIFKSSSLVIANHSCPLEFTIFHF